VAPGLLKADETALARIAAVAPPERPVPRPSKQVKKKKKTPTVRTKKP
jgi:hypothetical protein